MATQPIIPGHVDWSGENPGIYLKESADGPFVSVLSFFRVVLSPHGRGHALLMLASPQSESGSEAAPNLCLCDNEKLARWLVADFASHFGAFKDAPGMRGLRYRPLTSVEAGGDPLSAYTETVRGEGIEVTLSWEGLGEPFALALPPEKSATGKHTMLSLFVSAERSSATLNGRKLPGTAVPRDMAGRQIKTAFLAFSETWVRT
jgi:hypothetical protein